MRKFAFAAVLAAVIALPSLASAQAGGVCLFSGSASLNEPLGATPVLGHKGYKFGGDTSGPACSGLAGKVTSNDGKFPGPAACAGNAHQGTASTNVGTVAYAGVCAGPDCSGAGYSPEGRAFQYNLVFDADTLTRATVGEECANNVLKTLSFDGTAEGGSM